MLPISFARPPLWFSAIVTTIIVAVAAFLVWTATQDTEPIPVPMGYAMEPPGTEGD